MSIKSVIGGVSILVAALAVFGAEPAPDVLPEPAPEVLPVPDAESDQLTAILTRLDGHDLALTAHADRIEVVEQLAAADVPELVVPAATPGTLPGGWHVELWSAAWCPACVRWKSTEQKHFVAAEVTEIDYDSNKQRGKSLQIRRLPTFRILDEQGTVRHTHVGSTTAESLQCRAHALADGTPQASSEPRSVPRPVIMRDKWGSYRSNSTYHCGNAKCEMCNTRRRARQEQSNYTPPAAPLPAGQRPAPAAVITAALASLDLGPDDTLADLGCGDGRVLTEAVRRYGCRGIGVEIDPSRAAVARGSVAAAGLSDRIEIITGDATTFDLAGVSAVYVYLWSDVLEQLDLSAVPKVASVFHAVPGLSGTQRGDVWVYLDV